MAPFMGVSGLGGPGSALGKYIPDPRLSDTYWIASLETQGGLHAVSTYSTPDRNEGHGIAVDNADGSVYVCGHEVRGYGTSSAHFKNLYLVKYDKAGTLQWQRRIGVSVYSSYYGSDSTFGLGRDVMVDSNSDVYVFGHGIIGNRWHSSFSNQDRGVLMAKYNSSGDIIWQRHLGGQQNDETTNGGFIDDGDKIYLPMITKSINYSSGSSGFQMMYNILNTDGTRQTGRVYYDTWSTHGSVNYSVAGVLKDSSDNVILVGHTDGHANATSRFGGIIVKFAEGTEGSTTAPIFKYALYYQDGYGRQDVKVHSVAQDSLGNLYLAGTIIYSQGHAQSIPEEAFICQLRYDVPETRHDDGTHATPTGFWCKRFRYSGTEKLRSTFENGQIRVDSNDDIVAVGSVTKISSGEKDYLIMKLDTSGNEIWTRTLNNFTTSSGNSGTGVVEDSGAGLAIDNRDNIYVSGTYARGSDRGTMIAKLPGDGSLNDVQGSSSYTGVKILHGGRYRYSNNDGSGSYSYYYDEIGAVGIDSSNYYRMYQDNTTGQVNSNYNHILGFLYHGETTMHTGIGSMGHTVSVIHDVTPPSATYDYSFPDEVYYGDGTIGTGSTIPLGTQNYHYSGDGTMPAVGLGTVQNWDMFFELKREQLDINAYTNGDDEEYVIGNNGFAENNGFMLHFKDTYNHSAATWVYAGMEASADNTPTVKTLLSSGLINPKSTENALPMRSEWNWFKLEWRGGTSFKIWHKKTPTGNYTNLYTNTGIGSIHSGTDWNYISIGQVRQNAGDSFTGAKQFFGRIKNFGLNVNSNVVDLSDNTNISTHKLIVHIDASNPNSYSGIGSTCNNLARIGIVTDIQDVDNGPGYYGLRNNRSYADVVLYTGSGLDPVGATTSLSAYTTLNGVPAFTNLRGYSSIQDLAVDENGAYQGPFNIYDTSYSIWYYATSGDFYNRYLISPVEASNNTAGWAMGFNYSGQLFLATRYHGAETTSITLTANNWYNICAVHSSNSTVDVYINGVKEHTGSTTWGYNYSFDNISIGGRGIHSGSSGDYYDNVSGPIASVAVYNKRLYESEVESNYNRNCTKYGLPYLTSYQY